jgi:hypothetical protein
MELNNVLVSSLFTLLGVLIASLVSFVNARMDKSWKRIKKQLFDLCDQIESFYELEKLYIDTIHELEPKLTIGAIKKRIRGKLPSKGILKPSITSQKANEIKRMWG